MKTLKLIAICAITMTFAACTGDLSTSIWAAAPLKQMEGAIGLPDGIYSGVGSGGFGGDIYVDVTIEADAISDITVTGHNESLLFANQVFNLLIPTIMARQATGIDIIAGATYTSVALIAAIEDALVSGGAVLADLRAGPGIPALAAAEGAQAAAPAGFGPFTPGTFEGVGRGYYGDIHLAVTFDETSIITIEVTQSEDTPLFAGMAFNTLIPRVLLAQTLEVDIVAGATYSSDGFIYALIDAVNQAMSW